MNISHFRPYYDDLLELPTLLIGGPSHGTLLTSLTLIGQSRPARYIRVHSKRGGRKPVAVIYERGHVDDDKHAWVYTFRPGMVMTP